MCTAAPVAAAAWRDDRARWGSRVTYLGIVGDQSHQGRTSSHNCGARQESPVNGVDYDDRYAHALDTGVGGDTALGMAIVAARVRDPRVRYCIYRGVGYYGHYYRPPGPDGRTRTFTASGHPTHVHTSFLPGTTFDTRPFDFLGGATSTTEGWGTMTDAEIRQEFANQDDRIVARVVAELAGTKTKPAGLAATQQRIIRKLNRLLTAAGLKTD